MLGRATATDIPSARPPKQILAKLNSGLKIGRTGEIWIEYILSWWQRERSAQAKITSQQEPDANDDADHSADELFCSRGVQVLPLNGIWAGRILDLQNRPLESCVWVLAAQATA